MSIVNSQERARWPCFLLAMFGLHYIEDDRHSILIVVADEALVGICRIGSDNSISFVAALGRLMVRNNDASAWCQGQSCGLLLIFVHHAVCVDHS